MTSRTILIVAGVLGAIGIAAGAFGAHSLPNILRDLPDTELIKRKEWLETGVKYHMYHVAALLAISEAQPLAADEVQSDCAMCHAQAPVPDGHPPVGQVSVAGCGMCHSNQPDDGYFSAVHSAHSNVGLDCSSCHGDAATDDLRKQLDALLQR